MLPLHSPQLLFLHARTNHYELTIHVNFVSRTQNMMTNVIILNISIYNRIFFHTKNDHGNVSILMYRELSYYF